MINKLPIVIHTPSWTGQSGGIMILHKLAHELKELGKEVYVYPIGYLGYDVNNMSIRPDSSYSTITESNLHRLNGEFVCIYPEIIPKNPLHSKYVVRWLLYEVPVPWPATPEGCQIGFCELFVKNSEKYIPVIHFTDYNLSVIDATPNTIPEQRFNSCFTKRKWDGKSGITKFPRQDDLTPIEIKGNEGITKTVEIFKKSRYFYSHDKATAWLPIAAACGCVPVIMNDDVRYRKELPSQKYGIACGFDDVDWARMTQHLVRPYLEELNNKGPEEVRKMLSYIYSYYGT